MERCFDDCGHFNGTLCMHGDGPYFAWFERRDNGPLLALVNAYVAYTFSTIDLGPYRALSVLVSTVATLLFYVCYEALGELSILAARTIWGSDGDGSFGALRSTWGGAEPLLGLGAARLAGIALAIAYVWALRAPALFRLDDAHVRRRRFPNIKYALQRLLVGYAAFYAGPTTAGDDEATVMRYELVAYAALKTCALLIVYVWNRQDVEERRRLYGPTVRDYDVRWFAFFVIYALLLAGGIVTWTTTVAYGSLAFGIALVAAASLYTFRLPPHSAYTGFARL